MATLTDDDVLTILYDVKRGSDKQYEFIFLTLTVKNVEGKDLKRQIDRMIKGYKALCLRKRFKDAIQGWAKCFEVTYNWSAREFHPHYHCVLAVPKSYFTTNLYIAQDDWCLMWQDCLQVDYKPIVDVRVFKESEKGKGKEVAEVAKYTIKSSNIMANLTGLDAYSKDIQDNGRRFTDAITDEIVSTLDSVLHRRRLMEYGGLFKQKHKAFNFKDDINSDTADLIHTTETDNAQTSMDYSDTTRTRRKRKRAYAP